MKKILWGVLLIGCSAWRMVPPEKNKEFWENRDQIRRWIYYVLLYSGEDFLDPTLMCLEEEWELNRKGMYETIIKNWGDNPGNWWMGEILKVKEEGEFWIIDIEYFTNYEYKTYWKDCDYYIKRSHEKLTELCDYFEKTKEDTLIKRKWTVPMSSYDFEKAPSLWRARIKLHKKGKDGWILWKEKVDSVSFINFTPYNPEDFIYLKWKEGDWRDRIEKFILKIRRDQYPKVKWNLEQPGPDWLYLQWQSPWIRKALLYEQQKYHTPGLFR